MAADGYQWWTDRFRRMKDLFDELRVDHFRALPPTGPSLRVLRLLKTVPGKKGRASICSAPSIKNWAD